MTRVLYIKSSPRGDASASHRVANAYIDALYEREAVHLDTLDVWKEDLPAFDGAALEAKYAGLSGKKLTAEQQAAWQAIEKLGTRFRSADQIVISVPMWNFGIPYRLKHLIDLVTQNGVTFRFSDGAFEGLLKTQRAVFICARGLGYGPGGISEEQFDYQKTHLTAWANFVGMSDVHSIRVEKTMLGLSELDAAITAGISDAVALANRH